MTGTEAFAFLQARLGIAKVASDRWDPETLYDYLSAGRDHIQRAFALAAPMTVQELVTLTDNGDGTFSLPSTTADPLRCLILRSVTGKNPLTPTAELDQDAGEYEWTTLRMVTLAEHVSPPGGIEGFFILDRARITGKTTGAYADWGIPSPTHRCAALWAAILALTENENSDASSTLGMFNREIDQLERVYAQYDGSGGMVLREALLASYGAWQGENLY